MNLFALLIIAIPILIILFTFVGLAIYSSTRKSEGMVNPKYYRDFIGNWKWKYDNRNKFFTPAEYNKALPY